MRKLSNEEKIEIYNKVKEKVSVTYLSKKYNISRKNIYYLVELIDKHGKNILVKKKKYSLKFKEQAVKRIVENNESIRKLSIEIGLISDGTLNNWVSYYKKNGYNIIKRKRGPSIMKKKPKKNEKIEEKIKRLEEENLYLKAELEYSKKLEAVVQARKNQQQKKK
jgi:transposase